jgi:hypothetical protein
VIIFTSNKKKMVEDSGGEYNGRQIEEMFDVTIYTIRGTFAASV